MSASVLWMKIALQNRDLFHKWGGLHLSTAARHTDVCQYLFCWSKKKNISSNLCNKHRRQVSESSIFMHSSLSKCKVTWTRKVTHCKILYNSQEHVRSIAAIKFNLWSRAFRTRFLLQVRWHRENLNLRELKCVHIKFRFHTAYFYS